MSNDTMVPTDHVRPFSRTFEVHFQGLFKDFWGSFARTFQGLFLVPSTIDSHKNRQYSLFN